MVKTPSVRHSKSRKAPVTIELEASRLPADATVPVASDAPASADPIESLLVTDASEAAVEKHPAETVIAGEGFTMSGPADAPEQIKAGDVTPSNEALLISSEAENPSKPSEFSQPKASEAESGEPDATASPSSEDKSPRGFDTRDSKEETVRLSSKAPETPAARPEPKRSGLSAVAAGIIGGVITLLGAGALQYGGLLPTPGSGGSAAVEDLRTEIANLHTELASLKAGGGDTAVAQTVADLQARLDTLTGDVGTLKSAVESGGAGENAGLAALDGKIAELQTQLAQLGQAAGGTPVDLTPLNDKIAALEAGVRSAADAAAAGDTRLTTLEQSVAALTAKLDAQGNQPKIALSIASSALKAAIDRGQPFAAELETLAAISPDLPQLAALRSHAEAGVATRDDLLAEMDAAANAMIAAAKPVDPNAGYLDQLFESAASLVTVRPVGAVAGEGVPETVARMEAALKAGDLAQALTEYETLPEAAKTAGSAFAAKVKARVDVEMLVDQAIAEAMKTV